MKIVKCTMCDEKGIDPETGDICFVCEGTKELLEIKPEDIYELANAEEE